MAKEKYGFTGEYNYYVGVLMYDNELRFVTSVDYRDKSAEWAADGTPKVMTKQMAIDLQMGLCCNGCKALVIEAPDFLTLKNVEVYPESK